VKTRDVVTGFVVLIIIIAGVLWFKNSRTRRLVAIPTPTPISTIEKQVTQKFGGLKIPANADKADLTDVSGGIGLGEAARTYQNGKFSLTVLADLPDPKTGYFYQGWIVSGTTYVSLGKLRIAKGGYLVDFTSSVNYSNFKKVVVTLEKVFNNTPETRVLEGSF
jgi:hypothetical protein